MPLHDGRLFSYAGCSSIILSWCAGRHSCRSSRTNQPFASQSIRCSNSDDLLPVIR